MKNNGLSISLLIVASIAAAESKMEIRPGRKELFLDDHAVARIVNLDRTMHQPEKKGAVFRPNGPTDGIRVQTATAPIWVEAEGVYKLFYMAFPYENSNWVVRDIGCALAVSKDGLRWERPDLGEVSIRGSKANNRFYVVDPKLQWGNNSANDFVYDPHDPDPSRRCKGFLGAIGRVPVVSPDGIHWRKLGDKTIPSNDTSSLVYDEVGKRYIATVKTGTKYGRSAAVTFSTDFVNWTKPRMCFHTDDEDQAIAKERIRLRLADPGLQNPMFNDPDPETRWKPPKGKGHIPTWRAETYRLAVFPYEGVYMGLPMIYYPTGQALPLRNNTVGVQDIQLAFSRDPQLRLENWVRLGGRRPFIETSRLDAGLVGNFDRQQICPLNRPLVMGNELWFYYTGSKGRTPPYKMWPDGRIRNGKDLTAEEQADFDDGWMAICLAVLRLDGFVSLDAGEDGGEVVTKPFEATGSNLFLNVDVKQVGHAKVEVLGDDGGPLAGFGLDDSVKMRDKGVRQEVVWQTGSSWQLLKGQTVSIRICLKNASLYAFWTEGT